MPVATQSQLPIADLLLSLNVLDESSVDFLKKIPLEAAKDILVSIGPEVRNPSAFVTRRITTVMPGAAVGGRPARAQGEVISFFAGGTETSLVWTSTEQAMQELVIAGILDERSADFLTQLPEETAKGIIRELGPEVRNPSAFVTKLAKKLIDGA